MAGRWGRLHSCANTRGSCSPKPDDCRYFYKRPRGAWFGVPAFTFPLADKSPAYRAYLLKSFADPGRGWEMKSNMHLFNSYTRKRSRRRVTSPVGRISTGVCLSLAYSCPSVFPQHRRHRLVSALTCPVQWRTLASIHRTVLLVLHRRKIAVSAQLVVAVVCAFSKT